MAGTQLSLHLSWDFDRNREVAQSQLKPELVSLAADVCHQVAVWLHLVRLLHLRNESCSVCHPSLSLQLFEASASVVEVTQTSLLDTTLSQASQQPGGAKKKRRLESGWDVIQGVVNTQGHSLAAVPWLQVLTALLRKYPSALPETELEPLLAALQHAYMESKKVDVVAWLQCSLCSLAHAQSMLARQVTELTRETCVGHWNKVWMTTLRLISLHHTKEEGFQLLSTILQEGLAPPGKDVWTLFLPNLCQRPTMAVQFLGTILQNHDIPESYRPNMLVSLEMLCDVPHPLRHQLLDWLLPARDDWSSSKKMLKEQTNAALLAGVAMSLTLRDHQRIKSVPKSHRPSHRFEKIEKSYLKTTFDLDLEQPVPRPDAELQQGSGQSQGQVSVLQDLEKKLNGLLVRDSQLLLEVTDLDVSEMS